MLEALENQVQDSAQAGATSESKATLELRDMKQTINDMFERMETTLDRLSVQAERLSDGASDLATVAGSVETRMNDVTRALREALTPRQPKTSASGPADLDRAAVATPAAPPEPQFTSASLNVALAAVPGFQGLMDAQRALSAQLQADGASVVAYKNGEAMIEVELKAPVTARQVVEGLQQATGKHVIIEESRPEADKLRLRFVEGNATA